MPAPIEVVAGNATGMKSDRLFDRNRRGVPGPLDATTLLPLPVQPVRVKTLSISAKFVAMPDVIRIPLELGEAALDVADV